MGREIHYRGSEGVHGYQAGDVLIDDETGQRMRAVQTGHGVQLEPVTVSSAPYSPTTDGE